MLNAAKFGSRPLLECRTVTLPIGERETWRTQSEFCTWQNSITGQQPPKMNIYSLLAQITAKHRAKFGWLPLSDIAAVTKPRRESHWNQLECPKLPDRSQPLVHRSFPYCENMWRRYCCLTSFFSIVDMCLSCEDIGRQSCVMVPGWRFLATFASFFSEPRAARFRPAS